MRLRRWGTFVTALAVAVLVGLVGSGSTVSAADVEGGGGGRREIEVSGSFTGTGNFESIPECPSFHTWHDGSGDWAGLGAVTFNLDYCVELTIEEPSSPLSGTFTITAPRGTLTGRVEGEVANVREPEGYPATYTLTITGGTGRFTRARGTLVMSAFWDDPAIPVLSIHGTVSGTIVLRRAS